MISARRTLCDILLFIPFSPLHFMKAFSVLALATFLAVSSAHAHHGQDFLLLEDYHLPAPGSGHLLTNFEWENGDADEYGLTPAFMLGILPQLALSVEADFRDEATSNWDYSSVTPMAHFQITPSSSTFPIKFGISAGYQFGNADEASSDHHSEEAEEHDHEAEAGHHDEHDADAHAKAEDEAEHAHDHSGSVHAHGVDAFMGRFIVEGDFGDTKAIFNLLSVVTDDEAAWGYAAGVRHKFTEQVALGVEALGDFESDGWHEIDLGAYYEPVQQVTLKLGAGFGLTDATPDFILRTGVIWRF